MRKTVLDIPEETALRFILEEDHPDWATILEMAADVTARLTHPHYTRLRAYYVF